MSLTERLLDGSLMPHGHCLVWRWDLLALHIGGDVLTSLSYFLIPVALVHLVRSRADLAFDRVFLMFASFILFCGLTHLVSVVNIWHGYYFIEGLVKIATGLVSIATAVLVWRLMPQLLAIPSNDALRRQNLALAQVEASLVLANQQLEQRVAERTLELQRLAVTDELTGLSNRRALVERLERELARCRRYGHRLSLMIIDLDNFKSINDNHGHATGDTVLIETARRFSHHCRETDMVGRYGGEEFLVLLPDTEPAEATELAERLREALVAQEIPTATGSLRVSCSIGVAAFHASMEADALLRAADEALYKAKHSGKNRVETFTSATGN